MNVYSYKCCTASTNEFDRLNRLSSLLKLVGDQSRLQLLCLINQKPHCVCDIQAHFPMSQSLISHHLADLKSAGLVIDSREGRKVVYQITPLGKQVYQIINTLL